MSDEAERTRALLAELGVRCEAEKCESVATQRLRLHLPHREPQNYCDRHAEVVRMMAL